MASTTRPRGIAWFGVDLDRAHHSVEVDAIDGGVLVDEAGQVRLRLGLHTVAFAYEIGDGLRFAPFLGVRPTRSRQSRAEAA